MDEFLENKKTSDILFHQFMKCTMLMKSLLHQDRGHCHHHRHGQKDMLKIGQGRLLSHLLTKDGISQKELAELLRISTPSVNELVTKLETGGYIEKRQSETDKRATCIYLTEGGRFFAEKMEEERLQVANDIFESLDEDEQKQLLALLEKLISSLSNQTVSDEQEHESHPHHGRHHHERF